MRKAALTSIFAISIAVSGCSSLGRGSGQGEGLGADGLGDGNIPLASEGSGALSDVNFIYDSSTLSSQAQSVLQQNARWLNSNQDQKVVIEGHCDERGTDEYNLALGERRAQAVQNYLQSLGVSAQQLSTVTYGEELPLDPGRSEAAFRKNRRAHFALRK